MAWISPDAFQDPDSAWDFETNAYDENTLTRARNETDWEGWQPFLKLRATDGPIQSTKVRLWLDSDDATQIDIDTSPGGGVDWAGVFDGAFSQWGEWVEFEFPGGVRTVFELRIRFYDMEDEGGYNEVYEADFWEVVGIARPLVGGSLASSGLIGKGLARCI